MYVCDTFVRHNIRVLSPHESCPHCASLIYVLNVRPLMQQNFFINVASLLNTTVHSKHSRPKFSEALSSCAVYNSLQVVRCTIVFKLCGVQ